MSLSGRFEYILYDIYGDYRHRYIYNAGQLRVCLQVGTLPGPGTVWMSVDPESGTHIQSLYTVGRKRANIAPHPIGPHDG